MEDERTKGWFENLVSNGDSVKILFEQLRNFLAILAIMGASGWLVDSAFKDNPRKLVKFVWIGESFILFLVGMFFLIVFTGHNIRRLQEKTDYNIKSWQLVVGLFLFGAFIWSALESLH